MSENKKNMKGMSKIHRRKNEQVPKDFICPGISCGKAYGSYAALYTHMKNKHPAVKPPTMPAMLRHKNGQPGRPKTRRIEQQQVQQAQDTNVAICKICWKEQCQCVEDFTSKEKKKTIEIISNDKFINLTNQIGNLGYEGFSWVRRTEDGYIHKKVETLAEDIRKLNAQYSLDCHLPYNLADWLEFSSRYWDSDHIDELYRTFYIILSFNNYQQTIEFIKESDDFPNMKVCIGKNPNQFKRIESLIRII